MMKKTIRDLLKRTGLFERVRYGGLYRWYEQSFRPAQKAAATRETRFYKSFLPACQLIFDIGGYDGHKTEAFLEISRQVVCCEPDPHNFKILRNRFRNRRQRVFLENVALGEREGITDMYVHRQGSAFNTLNKKFRQVLENDQEEKWNEKVSFQYVQQVFVTTLDQLIARYGRPGFIKVDTEGHELQVVKGLSQAIPFISLECLLPEFGEELNQIMEHLGTLGKCTYNIAVGEELLWDGFRPLADVQAFARSQSTHHFELIVHMTTH